MDVHGLVDVGAEHRELVGGVRRHHEHVAADAFPLLGITDWDEFNARLLVGSATVVPRTVPCPIRMPYPPALNQGSIYENQTVVAHRYFEAPPTAPRALST